MKILIIYLTLIVAQRAKSAFGMEVIQQNHENSPESDEIDRNGMVKIDDTMIKLHRSTMEPDAEIVMINGTIEDQIKRKSKVKFSISNL